eukprot:1706176-Rhodomonas_salina.1
MCHHDLMKLAPEMGAGCMKTLNGVPNINSNTFNYPLERMAKKSPPTFGFSLPTALRVKNPRHRLYPGIQNTPVPGTRVLEWIWGIENPVCYPGRHNTQNLRYG